jgi:hypothetical protein
MASVNESFAYPDLSPETGLRRMSRRKLKFAYPNKLSGAAIDSKNTAGGSPCNYLKTYHLRPSRIGLLRKILYHEKTCGLSGNVLATRPGSRQVRIAQERAQTAVVAVLAPICVEKFQHQADASAKLVELQKVSSWDRRSIIEKGGWATTPGNVSSNSAVVTACAERACRL